MLIYSLRFGNWNFDNDLPFEIGENKNSGA